MSGLAVSPPSDTTTKQEPGEPAAGQQQPVKLEDIKQEPMEVDSVGGGGGSGSSGSGGGGGGGGSGVGSGAAVTESDEDEESAREINIDPRTYCKLGHFRLLLEDYDKGTCLHACLS